MKKRIPFRFSSTLATLSFAMTLGAHAANTWVGETSVWDTATTPNWTSPATWTSGDDAVFGDPGAGGLALALTTVSAHNLEFNTTGYTITGSTLTLTGSTPTITTATNVSATIGSIIAGASNVGLIKGGTGALTLTGTNSYTGKTTVNAGSFTISPTITTNGVISALGYDANGASTIRFDGSNVQSGTSFGQWGVGAVTLASGAKVELYSTATKHGNPNSNALYFNQGTNTFTGSGNLKIEGGGVVAINSTDALKNFTGTLNVNAGMLTLQGASTSAVGNFALNIGAAGKLDLRTETHKFGVLTGDAGAEIGSSNGGSASISIGNDTAGGSGTYNGNIGSNTTNLAVKSFSVTKVGTGTQTFTGANIYTGATTVNGGTLIINGTSTGSAFTVATGATLAGAGSIGSSGKNVTVSSGAFLTPGSAAGASIGTLTVNSTTLTLAAGSKTTCEINKAGATLTNDQLFTNAVVYGGTLEVTASGDPLEADDEFVLFDSTSRSGSFGTITLPTLDAGLSWDLTQLAVDGSIKVTNRAATPVFDHADGNHIGARDVTITAESGSTVYYTFAMGSVPPDPTTSSASGTAGSGVATVNLPTNGQWTVKAFATKPGMGDSLVAMAAYNLIDVPVWINPEGGFWGYLPEDADNWQDGLVAEGSGIPADFSTLALGADTTVTLDGDRTIGSLIFGDTGNQFDWLLNGFSASALTLAGPTPSITVNNQTATVSTPLAGSGGLVKTGAGDLILSGVNSYTGTTTVNGGALIVSPTTPGNTTLSAAGYALGNASTLRLDLSNVGTGTAFPNVTVGTISTVSGTTLELSSTAAFHTGPTTGTAILGTADNTAIFTGAGNINKEGAGAITINCLNALAGFTGSLNVNSGVLSLQGTNTSTVGNFAVNVASGATLDVRTDSHMIGALNGSGAVIKSYGGFTGTLTIGNGDASGDFSGTMANSGYPVTKTGTGTQILGGTLTYSGATTVNGGTLVINGASTNSAFTVASTGTLAGAGSIGGTVTVDASAFVAPGASGIGTLTLASATLNGTYQCDLDASTSDKVAVTGTLTLGGTANITFTGTPAAPGYVIASYDTLAGTLPAITPPAGYMVINDTTAKQIKLVVATGYGSWMSAWVAAGFTGDIAPGADPDGDGIRNLLEYLLNGNPGASDLSLLPQAQLTTTDFVFTFTRRVDSANDSAQVFEYGSDLAGWTPVNITGTPGAGVVIGTPTGTAPNEVQTVTVTIPRSAEGNGKLFGRLKVTQP